MAFTESTAGPGQYATAGSITIPGGRSLHGIVYVTYFSSNYTTYVETQRSPQRHEILIIEKRMMRVLDDLQESIRDFVEACEKAMIRAVEARRRRPENGYTDRPENEFALSALLLPAPLTFRRTTRRRSHNRGPLLNFCKYRPA